MGEFRWYLRQAREDTKPGLVELMGPIAVAVEELVRTGLLDEPFHFWVAFIAALTGSGAVLAIRFVKNLWTAPARVMRGDHNALIADYEKTVHKLEAAKKQNKELQSSSQLPSPDEHPKLDRIREWKRFIGDYELVTNQPLGKLNLIYEPQYAEMKSYLSQETRQRIESTTGLQMSLSLGQDVKGEIKKLILRDLEVLERKLDPWSDDKGYLQIPPGSTPSLALTTELEVHVVGSFGVAEKYDSTSTTRARMRET